MALAATPRLSRGAWWLRVGSVLSAAAGPLCARSNNKKLDNRFAEGCEAVTTKHLSEQSHSRREHVASASAKKSPRLQRERGDEGRHEMLRMSAQLCKLRMDAPPAS